MPSAGRSALEEGRYVAVEPGRAGSRAPQCVHRRVAAPEPAVYRARPVRELGPGEGRKLEQADPAGERLRNASHQRRAGRPEQDEASLRAGAIDHVPERGEELREPLRFVDHDALRVHVEEALEICAERAEICGALEIELLPACVELAHERALAGLPRPTDQHGEERSQELGEATRQAPIDPFHTL